MSLCNNWLEHWAREAWALSARLSPHHPTSLHLGRPGCQRSRGILEVKKGSWGEGSGDRQSQTSLPQGHRDVGTRQLLWWVWLSDLSSTGGLPLLSGAGGCSRLDLGVCGSWSASPGRQWSGLWGPEWDIVSLAQPGGAGPAEGHRQATLTDGFPVAPGDGVGARVLRALPGSRGFCWARLEISPLCLLWSRRLGPRAQGRRLLR